MTVELPEDPLNLQAEAQPVGRLVADNPKARAAALMGVYQVAVEQADGPTAIAALQEAAQLDPERWTPFPLNEYEPQRLLGVGACGVVFRCRQHKEGAAVIIRVLRTDDLDRDAGQVIAETRELAWLDHPAILRPREADYAWPEPPARPYLVFEDFAGLPLDQYLDKHGPLAPRDFLTLARALAGGLQAAHGQGIVHGQVKPSNVLVQHDDSGWRIKLTDFGLVYQPDLLYALPAESVREPLSVVAASLAGAHAYAAPEQTGHLPGVPTGPYSDLYGFSRTCYYALFRTPQPAPEQWQSLPEALVDLLEQCLSRPPRLRPADFATVLQTLDEIRRTRTERAHARTVPIKTAGADRPSPRRAVRPAAPKVKRHAAWPWMLGGGIIAALLLIGLAIAFVKSRTSSEQANTYPVLRDDQLLRIDQLEPRAPIDRAGTDELARFVGDGFRAACVAFGPDGRRVVSSTAGPLWLWDLEPARLERRLEGPACWSMQPQFLAFSPDGRLILHGRPDGTSCLYDAATGRLLHRLVGDADRVRHVAFSADGRRAISAGSDHTIQFWNVETGAPEGTLHIPHAAGVLALSSDGRRALVDSTDGTLQLWDLDQKKKLRSWPSNHQREIAEGALSADGRRAASSGGDPGVRVWDTDIGRELLRTVKGGSWTTTCLALSVDGRRLVVGDSSGEVRVWDVATGQEVKHFQGHRRRITAVAFSPDGRKVVSSSEDATVSVWKVE
jgi:serine/threonine protein kinase